MYSVVIAPCSPGDFGVVPNISAARRRFTAELVIAQTRVRRSRKSPRYSPGLSFSKPTGRLNEINAFFESTCLIWNRGRYCGSHLPWTNGQARRENPPLAGPFRTSPQFSTSRERSNGALKHVIVAKPARRRPCDGREVEAPTRRHPYLNSTRSRKSPRISSLIPVSYTHLRAHET